MLSKEAFNLSHNFIINQMTLYPFLYSNPLEVLNHLFFANGNGYKDICEQKGMLSIFDVCIVTQEDIEAKVRNYSSYTLYDLYAHEYPNMNHKDIFEAIFADEIKQYNLEELLENDFNLDLNVQTHFDKIISIYSNVLERNISDLIYTNSFGNSEYELFSFAYNNRRLMELLIITARYKISLMEKLSETVNFSLEGNRYYDRSKGFLVEFQNILNNLKH